jgi:hypothetical protein
MKLLIIILAFVVFAFGQDTIITATKANNSGALIGDITAYSPTVAYNGFTHDAKGKITTINISAEIQPFVYRDTTRKSQPPFMQYAMMFPDSSLTLKEQAWMDSLTRHFKGKMRSVITLDTMCHCAVAK